MEILITINAFLLILTEVLVITSESSAVPTNAEGLDSNSFFNEIQLTLIIVVILLGFVLFLFLFYNFKNNLRKQNTFVHGSRNQSNASANELALLQNHPTPTCICNLSGEIRFSNISFNHVFGALPDKLNGLRLLNILPSYIAEILTFDINHIQKGRTGGFTSQSFVSAHVNEKFQLRWQLLPVKLSGEQELMVTLEKMAETQYIDKGIEEPKDLVRHVLDNSPIAIFIEDYNGVILEVNQTACKLHQFTREELIGKSVTELQPISYQNEIIERQKKMAHHETFSLKSVSYTKTGKTIPVEIFVNRTNFFGTPALFFLVQDLTDYIETKKQLEEYKIKAEESDRLKSSFLANLSHEVRTPMNSILGFAELLAEPSIEVGERKEFIKLIRQSGKELLTQINNMIDFSKIEAGLINLKVEICHFDDLFSQLKDFSKSVPEMNPDVRLFFDLPQEIIKNSIATDFSRLKQILEILLHNSIKYTKKGVIEVGVKSKGPQLFEFYVRDTGIGIEQEKHRQIFEKFRQVNDTNSREFSGMGLGLSVAARLIQFLGGHQWVTSEPGKGSEFRCILPDLLQPQDSPYLQVSCGPSTVINKIMIVSPTEEIYNDLTQNSKPINFQVFWAQNAQEMKSMLLSNRFLYILIAVDQLPFWQELLPKIKKDEEHALLIGISDRMDIRRKERLLSMGLNQAIPNPANISTLVNLIENEQSEVSPLHYLTSNINQN